MTLFDVVRAPARLLHDAWNEPRAGLDLAVVRVVVFVVLAVLAVQQHPAWMAALPRDLMVIPKWTGWLAALPINPTIVRATQVVTVSAAILAALGIAYRVSAPVAVLGALYLLGVPQLFGKVDHYHNVWWFAAILAVSPAADSLAPGVRPHAPSLAYGRPLAAIGLLIGVCYLMPGLAKASTGWQWIWSDNLRYVIWEKWAETPGFRPLVRLDHWPVACRLFGALTVVFELSFLGLTLHRRTRPLALAGGLGFHAGSAAIMGINFSTLYICYVAFIRWPGRPVGTPLDPRPLTWAPTLVSATLLVLALVALPLGVRGWPIAYFPTFAAPVGPTRTIVRLEGVRPEVEREIARQMEPSRWDALLHVATSPKPRIGDRVQRGILELVRRLDPTARPTLRVVTESIVPADTSALGHGRPSEGGG